MVYPNTAHPSFWASTQGIHDEAKLLAEELRRDAMQAFWRDLGAGAASAAGATGRAAQRLRHRLARHLIVREVPAGDWGYEGRTQKARALARQKSQEWRPEVEAG